MKENKLLKGENVMKLFTRKQITLLEEEIKRLHEEIAITDPESEKYETYLSRLTDLYNLKKNDYKVSPDTVAIVAGNLAGILIIIGYEKVHVISSKALGFVLRGRV